MSHATKPARDVVPGSPVTLRDGSKVLIRQVQSTDAPLLADGFARLSPRSRQMRFLTGKKELSRAELRYLTDVDHHDHEALGALNHADGRGVGVARYVRHAEDPRAAEIAVTIVDAWQGRGLGTELLTRLSGRARAEGIHRFTALVASDNVVMAGMLRNMSANLVGRAPGTAEYEIMLIPPVSASDSAGGAVWRPQPQATVRAWLAKRSRATRSSGGRRPGKPAGKARRPARRR